MALNRYEVTLAGGEKVVVEAPEGALGSEIYQLAIDKNKADQEAIKNRPGPWDAAAYALEDASKGLWYGLKSELGVGDAEQDRKNLYDALANRPRDIGFTDIGGVKDAAHWATNTIGSLGGSLAPAAVAGMFGGPPAAVGALASSHLGTNFQAQLLEQERFKREGKYVPQTDVGAALIATAGKTALDLITFRAARIQEQFGFKISEQEALRRAEMDVAKQAGVAREGYLGSAGVGAMRAAPVEAGTEVAQQGLERWQAGQDLTGEDAMRDYIESAAGGALGGAALGTLGRRLEVGQAQQEVSAREALAQQQAQAQQEQLRVQQAAEQERQRREGVFQQGMAQAEQLDAFGVPEDITQPPAAPLPNTQGITQMPQFEAPVEQTAVQDEEKAYAAERVQRGKQEVKRLLGEGKIQEAAALQEQLIKETANLKQMGWVDPEAENTIVKNLSKVDSKIESLSQELMSVNTEGGTAKVLEKLQAVQDQRNNLQAQLDEIRKNRAPDTQEKFDFGTRAQEQTPNTGSAYDKPTDQNVYNGNAYAQRIFEAMGNNAPFTLSAEDMKDLGIVGARLRRDYPQFDLTNPEQRAAFKEALTAYDAEKTERGKPNPNRTSFIEALDQLDAQIKEKPVLEFTPSPRTEEQQAAEQARLGENLQQQPTEQEELSFAGQISGKPVSQDIVTPELLTQWGLPESVTKDQLVRDYILGQDLTTPNGQAKVRKGLDLLYGKTDDLSVQRAIEKLPIDLTREQAKLPLKGGKFGETENESGLKDWPTAQETQNAAQEQGTREVPMGEQPQVGEGVRVENQPRAEEAPTAEVKEKKIGTKRKLTTPVGTTLGKVNGKGKGKGNGNGKGNGKGNGQGNEPVSMSTERRYLPAEPPSGPIFLSKSLLKSEGASDETVQLLDKTTGILKANIADKAVADRLAYSLGKIMQEHVAKSDNIFSTALFATQEVNRQRLRHNSGAFTNPTFFSSSVPEHVSAIVGRMRQLIGLDRHMELHVINLKDIISKSFTFDGIFADPDFIKSANELERIGKGGVTGRIGGIQYLIYAPSTSKTLEIELLTHELGHIHMRQVFGEAPTAIQNQILREFNKWKEGKFDLPPNDFINSLRARSGARATKIGPEVKRAGELRDYEEYWTSFDEWYADQVSRWAVSSDKPISIVEKFFSKLGKAMRAFYSKAKNAGWLPNETFKEYMDNLHTWSPDGIYIHPEPLPTLPNKMRTSTEAATPQTQPQNLLQQIQTVPKSAMEKAFGWVMKNLDAGYGISEKYRQDETIPDEEKRALEHSARIGMISLAGHLNAVATEALRMGGIEYSKEFGKLQAVEGKDDKGNPLNFSGERLNEQVNDMAEAHGIKYIEARKIMHDALEGKRVLSLYKQQAQNEADAQALEAKNPKKYANRIKELRDKLGSEPFHITEAEAKEQADLFNQYPELKEIDKTKEGIRKWIADFLVDSGNWSKDQAEELLRNADWVPFQRKFDDNLDSDPSDFIKYHQSLQATYKSQKFKNSQREVNDILDNFDNWAMYAIRTAAKNYTVKTILQDALQRFGGAENGVRPISFIPTGKNHHVAFYFDKGHKHMVYFDNPLEASFFNSGFATPQVSKVIEFFNSMFRLSIVANPVFSVGQVMKDSIQAITKSGLPPREAIKIPLAAMKEMALLMRGRESETHKKLKSLGLVGAATDLATVNMEDLRQALGYHDLGQENKNVFKKLQNYGLKMAMWSDNAVRQAVYKAAIESGQTPTNASTLAANIINFRTQMGNHGLMFVASYVPFMRAGLADLRASLYTMSNRSLSSIDRKTARRNYIRTLSMMTGLSVLSAMALSDDEDYENMSPEQRARQWTIPGMGGFGVPRRVTLDSVPVVLAELVVNQFSKNATDSTRARTALSGIAGQVLMPIPDTLPAPIKAFIEQKTNYDWFTGDKIVGGTLERVQPYKQYGSGTSSLAKSLGEGFDMLGLGNWDVSSPKRIDHFIRSMLGSVGSAVLLSSNIIGSTFGNRPAMSSKDMMASIPGLSMPAAKEFNSSDRQDLYDFMDRVNTVVQTAKAIEKEGDPEELQKYYANNQELLKYEKTVRNISRQLSKVRAAIKLVSERPGDNANKTEEVRRLKEIEVRLVKNLDVKQLRQGAGL